MKTRSLLCGGALLAALALPAFAQTTPTGNTCMASVTGPREGRTGSDPNVDAVLWPPNHKFRTIYISATNSNSNSCDVTITDVRQDEPLTGFGSGNFTPDAANCSNAGNTSSVQLRGERDGTAGDSESGLGDGRFYHVYYSMHDPDYPVQDKSGQALVLVPHDQGASHIGTWIDEGGIYESGGGNTAISCSN